MILSMMSILISYLIKDTRLAAVVMLFITQIYNFGSSMSEPCIQYIKEAAGLPLTNSERFAYVLDKMKKDFPDAGGDFLRTIIQACYDAWTSRAI